MIRMEKIKAIAGAEARLTRRLARYWIFLSLSYLIALVMYIYYAFIHGFFSSFSATAGTISPRFLLGAIGLYYLFVFVVGAVFLAFDVRARDMRERVSEVLDSRPYTNLELLVGRFFGILLVSWIPIVSLAVILEILGLLLMALGAPLGEPLDITSLVCFVSLMVLPALSFALALVFLVTLLVRNRLVAAVLVLALLGGSFWGMQKLPMTYSQLVDIAGFTSLNFPSDLIPAMSTLEGWVQRFAILLVAFAMLGFGAAVHPRLDGGSRAKIALGGTGLILLAFVLTGFIYLKKSADIRIAETWKKAHVACADVPVPDLASITGEVKIDPGKALNMELDLTFYAPDEGVLEKALFTLNPGQKVTAAVDMSGRPLAFTHENGLLEITLTKSLPQDKETTVHLSIKGVPDNRFAFLESAIDLETMKTSRGGGSIILLGTESALFDNRFVALMPAIRWLPTSGSEAGRDDPRSRPVDFFTVDLMVDLPSGWLAAGPGRRRKVEGNAEGERFRFSPGAPVPEVALIASRFESRGIEIEGVFMELLVHPKHTRNIEFLADTGEKIQSWIGDRLQEADENGFSYPYDGLALVEVPSTLRSYGGGWRMDSVLSQPGLLLMREIGFPLARFDTAFRDPDKFKDKEGGIVQAKWERLQTFFQADFSGGNIFTGAARNFLMYQTAARGPEALALNYAMETLSSLLVTETTGYFSAHLYMDQKRMSQVINSTISTYQIEQSMGTGVTDAAIDAVASAPGIWEKILEVSLEEMDPWKDPADTVDVLTLKGNAVAQSILDTLGRENTGRLLSSLREGHKGGSYDLEDLQAAGKALGYDLDDILGDWLGGTALPGFVCSEAKIYRLPDSEDGSPRYQQLFTIRNDEPAPGVFRFLQIYYPNENSPYESITSDPIRLAGESAVRFGTVASRPPSIVLLDPYLSLNREKFGVLLPSVDPEKIEKADPVVGVEEIQWALPEEEFLVVDDLDPGFQVLEGEKQKGLRITARENEDEETDQGLPSRPYAYSIPSTWSRVSMPMFYGKYRHTMVAVKAGKGEKKAMFTTSIPQAGRWDLEVFIPYKGMTYPRKKWGTWHLTIKDGNGGAHEIEFDSNATFEGWNLAESFNLPEGEVSVTLSNETDGQFVLADAIRWSPSAGN